MPQPNDRHARPSSWDWGASQPSRSRQRAAAAADDQAGNAAPSQRKKGDCKGPDGWHPGHDLAFAREIGISGREKGPCQWQAVQVGPWNEGRYEPRWACHHEERCTRCGHVERPGYRIGAGCPDFPGGDPPEGVTQDAERKAAESRARREQREAARPARAPVRGRQGYRRRRGDR